MNKLQANTLIDNQADMLVHILEKMRIAAYALDDKELNKKLIQMKIDAIRIRDKAVFELTNQVESLGE